MTTDTTKRTRHILCLNVNQVIFKIFKKKFKFILRIEKNFFCLFYFVLFFRLFVFILFFRLFVFILFYIVIVF